MKGRLSHRYPVELAATLARSLCRVAAKVVPATLASLVSVSCWSAEPWRPPTVALLADANQVLVAVAVETHLAQEVLWKRAEVIQGAPSELFSTRFEGQDSVKVESGGEYVVAITSWRRHSLFREGLEVDPAGPRLVEVPGLGPAVFPYLPTMMRVLRSALDEVPEPTEYLVDLQKLMRSDWSIIRRFALTELYLRPEILVRADQETAASLRSILTESNADWAETELILTVGQSLTHSLQGEWLLQQSRRVVSAAPVDLELASGRPALVETALEIVAAKGTSVDGRSAIRHLASNSPGVVKQAVATVETLECVAGVTAARAILGELKDLHLESRQSLEGFVDRGCRAQP